MIRAQEPMTHSIARSTGCFVLHIALVLMLTLSLLAQQPQDNTLTVASGGRDTVTLTVTVTDGEGRFVSGLGKEHFAVSEGKTQHEINFFDDKDVPMSVGFVFDVSGSMNRERVRTAQLAVGRFIQLSHPETEYFIEKFGKSASELTDWTRDASKLLEGLKQVDEERPSGSTALYDACLLALSKLAQGHYAKQVLMIISDGQDNVSRSTFNELRQKVKESNALIYAIGIFSNRGTPQVLNIEGRAMLDELAAQSGGMAFYPDGNKELIGAAERIAVELRHQYVIGFTPGGSGGTSDKSKWRNIKIRVTPTNKALKGVTARTREGYYYPRATT